MEKLRPRGRKRLVQGPPLRAAHQHQYPALLRPVRQAAPSFPSQNTQEPRPFCSMINTVYYSTFTFTHYFKELEQVWGGGWGRDRCPSGARTPGWLPRTRAGREHQAVQSLGTSSPRAHAQQASSSSHINTDTLNKNSISSAQGIKTSLEYVQQRAWGVGAGLLGQDPQG